jgi:hypothetical protein
MAKFKVRIYIDQTYDVESDSEQGATESAIMELQKDGDMNYDVELLEGEDTVCSSCGTKIMDEDTYDPNLCCACFIKQLQNQ